MTTTDRGYGAKHQKLRQRVAREVAAGLVSCSRCGFPIAPAESWDLGHSRIATAASTPARPPAYRTSLRTTCGTGGSACCTWLVFPGRRIGEHVGQRSLRVTADTYMHVLSDERELDYEKTLA
jgi:hypothetical protein